MKAALSNRRQTGVRAAWGTAPGIEELAPRSSQCTVLENRLDKPCRLELGGGDLFNGTTNSVGCAHTIAQRTHHLADLSPGRLITRPTYHLADLSRDLADLSHDFLPPGTTFCHAISPPSPPKNPQQSRFESGAERRENFRFWGSGSAKSLTNIALSGRPQKLSKSSQKSSTDASKGSKKLSKRSQKL